MEEKKAVINATAKMAEKAVETLENVDDFSDILLDAGQMNETGLDIPNSAFFKGNYIPVDRKADTNFRDLMSILGSDPVDLGLHKDAKLDVPVEAIVAYNQKQRDKAVYRNTLNLAALLVDPKDPSTSKRAFALIPELRKVPEERLIKQTKLALMIESILRSGEITSRQEFMLVYQLLDPRAHIPEKYPWIELVESTDVAKQNRVGKANLYWVMNPFSYLERGTYLNNDVNVESGVIVDRAGNNVWINGAAVTQNQLKLKFILLRRLFPALKNSTNGQLKTVLEALYPDPVLPGGNLKQFTRVFRDIHQKNNTGIFINGGNNGPADFTNWQQ